MRPLKLYLKGFTVYKKPQELDFSPLRFFVIQGRTGAGKTSLIDAITFALYGKVPRYGSQDAKKLVLTRGERELRVSLDFSVRGKNYRIERYYRTFPEESVVRVYEGGKRLNVKAREVEKWVEKISGIDYRTFTKVILLPQGEFDRFLKDTRERKNILINLIDLSELERVRELASETYRSLEGELKGLKTEIQSLGDLTPEKLSALQKELKEKEERAEHQRELLRKLEEELRLAEEKESLERELSETERKLSELLEREKHIEELKKKLEVSRRVAPYVPVAERIKDLETRRREEKLEKEKLEKELRLLEEELRAVQEKKEVLQKELEELEKKAGEKDGIKLTLGEIERLKGILRELNAFEEEKKELEGKLRALREREGELQERVSRGTGYVKEVREELEKVKKAFSEEEYLKLKSGEVLLKELEKRERVYSQKEEELEALRQNLSELTRKYEKTRQALEKVKRELEEKELLYHAHRVAQYLSPGDPCPVCGGTFSHSPISQVDDLQLSELQARKEKLEREERSLGTSLELTREKLRSLSGELEDLRREIGELKKAIPENLQTRLRELEKLRVKKKTLEEKLEKYTKRLEERKAELEKARENLTELEKRWERLLQSIEERKKSLKDFKEIHGWENLEEYENHLREKLRLLEERERGLQEQLAETEEHLKRILARKASLEGRLSTLRENLSYLEKEIKESYARLSRIYELAKSPQEVISLYLGDRERELEREIKEYEKTLQTLTSRKQELQEKLKSLGEVRNLSAVRREYEEAMGLFEELTRRVGELRKEIESVRELLSRREELIRRTKEIEEKMRIYNTLRNDLKGDRFQKFVADIMLVKVVDRASHYFNRFTGTYHLEVTKVEGYREKDIVVVDTTTGQRRPVSSLSGGETFLASLALAFGVSDVLAGSANLESLFIDEGFGSLDQDMRDRVSEILEAVKSNVSRMIGIISHIPDIAERFEQKVLVEKKGDFSEIRVVI